ncbi:oxidoreductase [Herbidospora sp. RD11066]
MAAFDVPSQVGRFALVTGANSGIGYQTSLALARAGATVWLAGRDLAKIETARETITRDIPFARTRALRLDLADLTSIAEAARTLVSGGEPLDLLVNNAGVMAVPERRLTADGFELTFGTNHLGHFALTGRLLPALLRPARSRVVTVSAMAARLRGITFDDPQSERDYAPMRAYAKSKLANVIFTRELARRAAGTGLAAIAVHPGTSMTEIQRHTSRLLRIIADFAIERFIGHTPEQAVLPTLYAATRPDVKPGDFFAPTGRWELRGAPGPVSLPPAATDDTTAAALWHLSEQATGLRYEFAD